MHLLATQPGTIADGKEPVDLGQTPGDVLVLSAADSEIACLARAQKMLCAREPDWPSLRLASLLRLAHNYSVDRHTESGRGEGEARRRPPARRAGLLVLWRRAPGAARARRAARFSRSCLATISPMPSLPRSRRCRPTALHRLWRYLAEGGGANAEQFLRYAASLIGRRRRVARAAAAAARRALLAGRNAPPISTGSHETGAPAIRSPLSSSIARWCRREISRRSTRLVAALAARGLNPLPIFVASLKDAQSAALIAEVFARAKPAIVLNATGFAVASPGRHEDGPLGADVPVLQVIFAGGGREEWATRTRGLDARDIAMNVALPELDGRILARAVSFKAPPRRDLLTEADLIEL